MPADPYKYFRIEAAELHGDLGKGVLALERGEPDVVARLLRYAHTLKGAARVVKQREIADAAHAIEDVLTPYREAPAPVDNAHIDALLKLLDTVAAQIAVLNAPPPPPPPPPSVVSAEAPAAPPLTAQAPARPEETFRTLRANVEEMDALLEGIGEANVLLAAVRRTQRPLEQARRVVDLLVEQLASPRLRDGLRGGGALVVAKTHALAQELQQAFTGLERGFTSGVDQLDHELRGVRDTAEHMRLAPAGALFTAMERAVRDVAHEQNKLVVFEGRGGDVRLDAPVLSAVQAALLQVARNAVAHGIEAPGVREKAGKPRQGKVVLEVSRRGRRAVFACIDDGKGIDVPAVTKLAQERGLLAPGEAMDTGKLVRLLLNARLSTARSVTEVSGRGVGLDLLREALERLGGEAFVQTTPGQGTKLELVVPISLASLPALVVEAQGETVAIPLDAVKETMRVVRTQLVRTAEGDSLRRGDEVLPVLLLARVLGRRAPVAASPSASLSVVIIEGTRGRVAVEVDRLLGTATVIQRPLPELAVTTDVVAGASIDADGRPQLVLDPDGLVGAAKGARPIAEASAAEAVKVLVIDDSMTTRMLEQSILESAGYDVAVASSGEEGFEKAEAGAFAVILVDVEMPGMDGFTFIEKTRAHPVLRHVPCILVTSRADEDDRRRGREVGASGHIMKGEFDQSELLTRIRELVAR